MAVYHEEWDQNLFLCKGRIMGFYLADPDKWSPYKAPEAFIRILSSQPEQPNRESQKRVDIYDEANVERYPLQAIWNMIPVGKAYKPENSTYSSLERASDRQLITPHYAVDDTEGHRSVFELPFSLLCEYDYNYEAWHEPVAEKKLENDGEVIWVRLLPEARKLLRRHLRRFYVECVLAYTNNHREKSQLIAADKSTRLLNRSAERLIRRVDDVKQVDKRLPPKVVEKKRKRS